MPAPWLTSLLQALIKNGAASETHRRPVPPATTRRLRSCLESAMCIATTSHLQRIPTCSETDTIAGCEGLFRDVRPVVTSSNTFSRSWLPMQLLLQVEVRALVAQSIMNTDSKYEYRLWCWTTIVRASLFVYLFMVPGPCLSVFLRESDHSAFW
jgi:hypothetical protein